MVVNLTYHSFQAFPFASFGLYVNFLEHTYTHMVIRRNLQHLNPRFIFLGLRTCWVLNITRWVDYLALEEISFGFLTQDSPLTKWNFELCVWDFSWESRRVFKVVNLQNEPSCALIAFGRIPQPKKKSLVASSYHLWLLVSLPKIN